VRTQLAASLRGIVAQLLLKKADGKGRVAVNEILISNSAVSSIIREGAAEKLTDVLISGKAEGMQFMDDAIQKLYDDGTVNAQEAYMKGIDKTRFAKYLTDDGSGAGSLASIANNGGQPMPKPSIAKPAAKPPALKR
jgi:twitching motility protein PilT